jgi:O-antigen/teichoic acid export membrane protein
MSSITKAFYPVLFRKLNDGLVIDEKIKIVKITYLFFLAILIVGIFLNISLEFLYPYILGEKFQNTLLLSQLIVISFIFNGMYYSIVGYIFYFKKTSELAKITFIISIFHVIVSIIFIQLFGVIGVAYTLVISSFTQFIAIWYLSNTIYPMPWFNFLKKDPNAH